MGTTWEMGEQHKKHVGEVDGGKKLKEHKAQQHI